MSRPTPEQRFWAKVDLNGPVMPGMDTPCWVWIGAKARGYGRFQDGSGSVVQAHRFSYELGDPIPEGQHLDHLCRNPACVRPNHLEAVSCRTNVLRGVGASAVNAAKTECIHGHPLEGENLYVKPSGYRECRTCTRERDRRRSKDPVRRAKQREYDRKRWGTDKWKASQRAYRLRQKDAA